MGATWKARPTALPDSECSAQDLQLRLQAAWLAGFWDGEGSIGLIRNKTTFILVAQFSHTDRETVSHVIELLERLNIAGRGYTYQERDPAKHRDAHYVRVTSINNVRSLALTLLPFAVTKKRHWEIAIAWADSRIAVSGGIDYRGHLSRKIAVQARGYSASDLELYEELAKLNRRGPDPSIKRGPVGAF